jgi:hypothetical protein
MSVSVPSVYLSGNILFFFFPRAGIAQSVQRWATGCTAGFDSWQGQEIFLSSATSRRALGPTQPLIQWVPPRGKAIGAVS